MPNSGNRLGPKVKGCLSNRINKRGREIYKDTSVIDTLVKTVEKGRNGKVILGIQYRLAD